MNSPLVNKQFGIKELPASFRHDSAKPIAKLPISINFRYSFGFSAAGRWDKDPDSYRNSEGQITIKIVTFAGCSRYRVNLH